MGLFKKKISVFQKVSKASPMESVKLQIHGLSFFLKEILKYLLTNFCKKSQSMFKEIRERIVEEIPERFPTNSAGIPESLH